MPKRNNNHHERKRAHQIQRAYRRGLTSAKDAKRELHQRRRAQEHQGLQYTQGLEDLEDWDVWVPCEQHRDLWSYEHEFDQAWLVFDPHDTYFGRKHQRREGVPDITDNDLRHLPAKIEHQWRENRREAADDLKYSWMSWRSPRRYPDFEKVYEILLEIQDQDKGRYIWEQNEQLVRKIKYDSWGIDLYLIKEWDYRGVWARLPAPTCLREWLGSKVGTEVMYKLAQYLQDLGYYPWTPDQNMRLPSELR